MGTTPISSLPYPELANTPNVPQDLENLAEAIDTLIIPKFATNSARDAVITAPTDGQHAYMQDVKKLVVYRTSYNMWFPVNPANLDTIPEGHETRTSATFSNSAIVLPTKANTRYFLTGMLMYQGPSAADIKFKWVFDVAPVTASSFWGLQASNDDGPPQTLNMRAAIINVEIAAPTDGAPTVDFSGVQGSFLTGGTAGNMTLQWAQNSASGTSTLFAGSWIRITES